ncbi:MAG: methylated-DNA--[protein]-cysteine S-methyltransferase [Firmicutes bacterium]|nr:methylated-DNA--[protein]-cysteine S-methyltransferase [Bacillota bacterium]
MADNVYCYKSPIGFLRLESDGANVTGLYFEESEFVSKGNFDSELEKCVSQLEEYFAGKRRDFELNIKIDGTSFQEECWRALLEIPYGATCTYGDIAKKIGKPKSVRAVGGANHRNKISIIIPCHRVVGANGSLTGYGGELWRKERLLELESKNLNSEKSVAIVGEKSSKFK